MRPLHNALTRKPRVDQPTVVYWLMLEIGRLGEELLQARIDADSFERQANAAVRFGIEQGLPARAVADNIMPCINAAVVGARVAQARVG